MTSISRIKSPSIDGAKDPNESRDDAGYKARVEEEINASSEQPQPEENQQHGGNGKEYHMEHGGIKQAGSPLDRLKKLSATNRLQEMEENLGSDDFVFANMAMSGQIALFYGASNTGKTLLFLWFIIESIKAKSINAEDVFYINADDNYKGLFVKSQIADSHGFYMVSPAESNVSPANIITMLADMGQSGEAKGKIIIMDTLKKFADMMSKQSQATLYATLRVLVTKGATVIIAGHTNKHDKDGKLIYEGTGDTMNDLDCVYSMYKMSEREDEHQVIEFRNEKDRGDVIAKASFQYTKRQGMRYTEIMDSIKRLDLFSADMASESKRVEDLRCRYESEVLFVTELLTEGPLNYTDIMKRRKGHPLEGEMSVRGLKSALKGLEGIEWDVNRGEKNAKIYRLCGYDEDQYRRASKC